MNTEALTIIGAAAGAATGAAGVLWWLFGPRVERLIDMRIEAKLAPVRADIERHEQVFVALPHTLTSLDKGIEGLTKAVEKLTDRVEGQAESTAEMRGSLNTLLDRRDGRDRRDRTRTEGR